MRHIRPAADGLWDLVTDHQITMSFHTLNGALLWASENVRKVPWLWKGPWLLRIDNPYRVDL